ncbi:hypothetical protein C5F49_08320 [Nitrosopumilus oxyclinae]|uniref:Uncharacterized protein n=1 Tax=Nitrosopumilus oxyclinae TaxID=1959104 RepID=A0A7D5RC27_9ARCH|nr:hypothetical protein [Nitrosopumilus oxyclinae]QLH05323.1 hypothetical protein C5F49_08320 [Nitrosopumilus oxyclinae]
MAHSIFGQVTTVRKFAHGDIEFDFYHEDEITSYRFSSDPSRLGNFPKELAEILVSTLATDICVEIFFGDDGNPTHVELEECDDEEEELDDDSDSDD